MDVAGALGNITTLFLIPLAVLIIFTIYNFFVVDEVESDTAEGQSLRARARHRLRVLVPIDFILGSLIFIGWVTAVWLGFQQGAS